MPSSKVCNYQTRAVEREVCQNVQMQAFKEECGEVPRQVPKVTCSTSATGYELKEVCVNVELQLPREECTAKLKQDCRYVKVRGF
jgi:hypothetical protein